MHAADMDGFRLLEQVGLEMDIPVISRSPEPLFMQFLACAMLLCVGVT